MSDATPLTRIPGPALILGPAHGGKSELAVQLLAPDKSAVVVGTAMPGDPALDKRIRELRAYRPGAWETVESGHDLPAALENALGQSRQVLVDSVNQWIGALVVDAAADDAKVSETALAETLDFRIGELLNVVRGVGTQARLVLVSAEVGGGPAPARAAERQYRRAVGLVNRQLAEIAKSVIVVNAGIPQRIK